MIQFILFGLIALCVLYFAKAIINYYKNRKNTVEEKIKNRYPLTFSYEEDAKINDYENLPSEDEIQKYYKMYIKKYEIDTQDKDIFTTERPATYKEYRKRAKKFSEPVKLGRMIITKPGGYQFLISTTTDAINYNNTVTVLFRYKDYQAMVEKDERNGRNFFDDEKAEMKDESLESKVKDQIKEIFEKNA